MIREKIDDLNIANGLVFVKDNPKKAIPIRAVAGATYYHSLILSKDIGADLAASATYGIPTGILPDERAIE